MRVLDSLAGAMLRGNTARDVRARYDRKLQAILAWNAAKPEQGRALRASTAPKSFEVTGDHAKMNRPHFAGSAFE